MGTNQLYSTNHRGTGNPLIDADADPTVLVLWNQIFGEVSCLMAEPSGLSRKDIVHMASAFGKNLPKFDSTKGNAEGYVRAVVELIQQMGLQKYPNEMLTYLGKNLGSGTAEGNVIDGLMDRAKEQATEILVQQRRSDSIYCESNNNHNVRKSDIYLGTRAIYISMFADTPPSWTL